MKKILTLLFGFLFLINSTQAAEKVSVEKQLIGIVGAVSGIVISETRELLSLIHI